MRLYTTILCLLFTLISCAQLPKNNIYIGFAGPGISISINYERMFFEQDNYHFCASLGLAPGIDEKSQVYVPFTLAYNIGKNTHFFEAGVGYTHNSIPGGVSFAHMVIGYKKYKKTWPSFKLRFTPLIPIENYNLDTSSIWPWIGASVGFAF